jgi:hypothetical protein
MTNAAGELLATLAAPRFLTEIPMDAKAAVRALLERLPQDCTIEDVLYHLYVLQEVELAREDVADNKVLSHEQVAIELRRKWLLGAAG